MYAYKSHVRKALCKLFQFQVGSDISLIVQMDDRIIAQSLNIFDSAGVDL